MSQQEYMKKSLLSEIEESLSKGAGLRGSAQNDFSNKASETSERDYAIPIQCLRRATVSGLDRSYVLPEWQAGEFALKKEVERPIRAEAILENQLKFFFSKIEHNERILIQDDSKKADMRWKDRILATKLATDPFKSLLSHLKESRPSLFRALQHHPMVSGKYHPQKKNDFKKSKRERLDSDNDLEKGRKGYREQKMRKGVADGFNHDDDRPNAYLGEDVNEEDEGEEGHDDTDDKKNVDQSQSADSVNSYSMSFVVAKCIADGSLQAQLITLALIMHEYSVKKSSSDSTSEYKSPLTSLPIGNVLATLFENVKYSCNYNVDSNDGDLDENRKRLNRAQDLTIRNPFKSCLHLHYSTYQPVGATRTSTPVSVPASAASEEKSDVVQSLFSDDNSPSQECEGGDEMEMQKSQDEKDDSDDEDEEGEDEDEDEMLAAALAMSMDGSGVNFNDEGEEDDKKGVEEKESKEEILESTSPQEEGTAENSKSPSPDAPPTPSHIPLLSSVNPLSTFGPFCDAEFWRCIQPSEGSDDVALLPLQHVMVGLLVNIGAGVDKVMMSAGNDPDGKDKQPMSSTENRKESKKDRSAADSLSSLVNSITTSLVGGKEKERERYAPSSVSSSPASFSGVSSGPMDSLPIMAPSPITPHPISFLLIELILDMFVTKLLDSAQENSDGDSSASQKYFLVWSLTILLKLLKCNFFLLSALKIPPSSIGLVDPLHAGEGGGAMSVTTRLVTLVEKCAGVQVQIPGSGLVVRPVIHGNRSHRDWEEDDIKNALLHSTGKEETCVSDKDLTLQQVQHSADAYVHAIKSVAIDVMSSGFSIFYPSVPDRLAALQWLLSKTPVNSGLALLPHEKFSPFKTDEVDEFSSLFNHFDEQHCQHVRIGGRYERERLFYDSILLQKLCLNALTLDDISQLALSRQRPVVLYEEHPDFPFPPCFDAASDESEDGDGEMMIGDSVVGKEEGAECGPPFGTLELERTLFGRLQVPTLLHDLIAQRENTDGVYSGSDEVVMRSSDHLYGNGNSSSSSNGPSSCSNTDATETKERRLVCGMYPSQSLVYGEISLFCLLTQAHVSALMQHSKTDTYSSSDSLRFDSKRCNANLNITDEGRCVNHTKNKAWSTVLTSEGFEPGTGEHSWVVRVERSDKGHIFIGIGSAECSLGTYIGGDDNGWGLIGTKSLWHSRSKIQATYGEGFTTGSSVRVLYDSDNGRLYFSSNSGSDWGLAFENIPAKTIYPAVSLYQREDKVIVSRHRDDTVGGETASSIGSSLFPRDAFASVTPFVVFALSVFDAVEDILSAAEDISLDSHTTNSDGVSKKVAILSHPFISLIFPIISSSVVVNKWSSELASYLSVQLLPHLTLLTKRLANIHESIERYVGEKHSQECSAVSPLLPQHMQLLQLIVDRNHGLVGNISGLWRINSSAGGSSIPAQEYFLQLYSNPAKALLGMTPSSASDSQPSGMEFNCVDSTSNYAGKYRPVEITGSGQGVTSNVSMSGTIYGTRIRFSEVWHVGGSCFIDARLSLDGSFFFGTFKDKKSGIVGSISASRVYNSAIVSNIMSEEEKYAMQLRQSPSSNGLLKSALLAAMACGRLSANMIISENVVLPNPQNKVGLTTKSVRGDIIDESTSGIGQYDEEIIDVSKEDESDEGDDDDDIASPSSVGSSSFSRVKTQQSDAYLSRWINSELFSEGITVNDDFIDFIGNQLQRYLSINHEATDLLLSPKAVDLKTWWLLQVFHDLADYGTFKNDPNDDLAKINNNNFQFVAASRTDNVIDDDKDAMTVDSPGHVFYQQLQNNSGDGKILDEYVMRHVGLSSLCKIGGDAMQNARRRVLNALIYHSGYLEMCTAEANSLQRGEKSDDCKPQSILVEVWRASQKVIEFFMRQKQQTGVAYCVVSEELFKKADFLMDVVPNSRCKDVTRNLQTTLSSEFTKKRSFEFYGSSVDPSSIGIENAKNLSETTEFFQSRHVDVEQLKYSLRCVSFKALFRSAGLRSASVLLGRGSSHGISSSGSTASAISATRMPALSTLVVQSAVVEYILPSFYGICDFTSDLHSKWMARMPEPTTLPTSPGQGDPADVEEERMNKKKKQQQTEELNIKGHFTDTLQGTNVRYLSTLRQSFENLFELITQLLHRCTWAGDRDGQCVSLSAWDITVLPDDHSFLNRIGIFRVLQTVLDDSRNFLVTFSEQDRSTTTEDGANTSADYAREMVSSASKRLTQLALKIVHALASQIALGGYDNSLEAGEGEYSKLALPQLSRQASGPETLSQALFDMLYSELFSCLKIIIATSFGSKSEGGVEGSEQPDDELSIFFDSGGASSPQFEEIGGEKYAYRILRLLFSVSSSHTCRQYLCSPKWLTLLLAGVGSGSLGVQRRLLRLLRKLFTTMSPKDIHAYTTDFFEKDNEIVFSERALDDDDVKCLMVASGDDDDSKHLLSSVGADRAVELFLKASTANIVPVSKVEATEEAHGNEAMDNQNAFLLSLYRVPSGTNSLSAECISLLRLLQEVPSWKQVLCSSLRKPLLAVLSESASDPWNDPSRLRDVAASLGVMGGYVDRIRVGGTVILKPFSLVGLSETFALRLAAVSHSCGMVVAKNNKSVELVLMERSRKFLKSEHNGVDEKGMYSARHIMSLAGGTPIRSVKMALSDVAPTADVFNSPDFFDTDLLGDCLTFVREYCLPFLKENLARDAEYQRVDTKRREEEGERMEVDGDDEDDDDDDNYDDDGDDDGDDDKGDDDDDDNDGDGVGGDDDYEKVKRPRRESISNSDMHGGEDRNRERSENESPPVNVISDVTALQLYVSAASFRSTAEWMQNPASFKACNEQSRSTIIALLQIAVKSVQVGGLGELEAIEDRWASVWETYSLLKFKQMQTEADEKKAAAKESTKSSQPSDKVTTPTSYLSTADRRGNREQGNSDDTLLTAASSVSTDSGQGSASSGIFSSILNPTPSAADASRAREQMMDMGFPKEWCDVALRRCRYNVELAINLCFEHGSEMNELVAEEAAMQAARASSSGSGSGGSSRGSRLQADSLGVLERLAARSRTNEEPPSLRVPSRQRESSRGSNGSTSSGRRSFFSMGFPKSWCNRALEACGSDVDAAIAWIVSHGDELIAAEEAADKSESPAKGRSIEELLLGIGREESEEESGDESGKDEEDEDEHSARDMDVDDVRERDETELFFEDSPVVDCSNALSSLCGSVKFSGNNLTCGGHGSGGFPSVGCRGHGAIHGKWYYEVTLETAGCIQIGWVDVAFTGNAEAGEGVGDDAHSWAYDGWRLLKWNGSSAEWGAKWSEGDVVGCAVDVDIGEISFFLNGFGEEVNMGVAFRGVNCLGGLFPCLSYNRNEKCTFAFNGKDFKHRPPAGYRPYAEHIQGNLERNALLIEKFLGHRLYEEPEDQDQKVGSEEGERNKKQNEPYFIEDCMEEQKGESDFLSHKRYFLPDESRSGNNQLERQSQEVALKIINASLPTTRDMLLREFQSLSNELCVLYARLIILRVLSGYDRLMSEKEWSSVEEKFETETTFRDMFFSDTDSISSLMHLLKESSASTLRTKVYLQIMSILPSSALPPPNLGSVLTVGGLPTLNSVVGVVSSMLCLPSSSDSSGSGVFCNQPLLQSMLRYMSNELVNACRREFSADWVVENGGTPVIYRDAHAMSNGDFGESAVKENVPSLSLAAWLSSIIMQQLFVSRMDETPASIGECDFFLEWVDPLVSSWSIALKSPVIAVKMCASRNLSAIIQQFFFVNENTFRTHSLPGSFFSELKSILSRHISLERVEKLVLHRMEQEKSAYPICSEYLQSLIEFSISLCTALDSEAVSAQGGHKDEVNVDSEKTTGASDTHTNSPIFSSSHASSLHSYPSSSAETDSRVDDFHWGAISGHMLSDDGWEVWTGSVQQLDGGFSKPTSSGIPPKLMSLSGRQHESTPPALLPGCKVMRRRVVKIVKENRQCEKETGTEIKTKKEAETEAEKCDLEKNIEEVESAEALVEEPEVPEEKEDTVVEQNHVKVVGVTSTPLTVQNNLLDTTSMNELEATQKNDAKTDIETDAGDVSVETAESLLSDRRSAIADLHAANDRMRSTISKLLSEREKRKKRKHGGTSREASPSPVEMTREVMEFGTVIGVSSWPDCAPGTARIVRWDKERKSKHSQGEDMEFSSTPTSPLSPGAPESSAACSIETVRWGGEGKFDVFHVKLDPDSVNKKKKKIQTQYPWPSIVEEYADKNGFAADLSFGVILRLRSAPLLEGDEEGDICSRYDGLMEWPDFKSTVYVTGYRYSNGDWSIIEEKLVSGSPHTGWWARFGTSSWRSGTTYNLSSPTFSAAAHAQASSGKQLLGQFSYSVDAFVGQSLQIAGVIKVQQSQLFCFDSSFHAQSVQVSQDRLAAACTGGEGKCIAYANVGFSSGVHYWEYKVEQCDLGNIFVGVAEKPITPGQTSHPRLNKWYGYGFVNMRTSYRHTSEGSGERVYGDIFHAGDTVGVLLDMNRGALSFFLDGMKYGEHLLTDLGVAFDGLVKGNANNVQQKTLYPVVGFRRSGDRVAITPRWVSTTGNQNTYNDLQTVHRVWSLLTHWGNARPSVQPRESDLWTYREAWRDWLRWRSDRYLKVRTRCRGVSLNLTASLDKCPRACVDASIRLGLSVPLFHGDRIVFNSTCGRKLEAKEDAVVLGALRGQLWYRLDSQREGNRGAMLEGSNANLAWCLASFDVEDFELVRRGSVADLLPLDVMNVPLSRVPMFHGGLLRVVYENGAVMRGGLEIDAAEVICTVAHDALVFAVERRVNSSNIARYRVFYEGVFGWVSENIRGGKEELMVSKVLMDADNTELLHRLKSEALSSAKESGDEEAVARIGLEHVASPADAVEAWRASVLALSVPNTGDSDEEVGKLGGLRVKACVEYNTMFASGGLLSEDFRRRATEPFEEFLDLATTMDGSAHWPVECDMQLTEFISHTASKEGQSPYNLSCEQITSALAMLGERSPLKGIPHSRIIARASVIRVANSVISNVIPYLQLTLPEEKWHIDCYGSRETDSTILRKDTRRAPATGKDGSDGGRGTVNSSAQHTSSAQHIRRMDRELNHMGDNVNELARTSKHIWEPPCGARRLHLMRRVLFTQTKKQFWHHILDCTTTATPLNQDEYEDPREIKDIRINRVKATQAKLSSISNMSERIRQSVFGQLHREMRQWSASSFRRSYLGKGHGGQYRAFKVKFMGEGVNDYGGPYRAVFEQVVDELQSDSSDVGSKCLLPLLVQCPNKSAAVGPNQDKFVFASSTSPLIQEMMQFFGKLSGTALRHNLNMSTNLSTLLWRPLAKLPVTLRHLETIDTLAVKHLERIETLALELEKEEHDEHGASFIPDEWMDIFFTASCADGSKVSLIPGGEDIPLTLGNWREYLSLVESCRLRESSVLFKAYRNGLSSVLPVELFSLFTPTELDQLFSGNNIMDVGLLKQCTEYEGIAPDSQLAKDFWGVLEDMSDDDRTSFLRFVWARSRMPASAQDLPMNFKLQADTSLGGGEEGKEGEKNPDDYLPHAQTCFFSLSLPKYSSKEILRTKLLYAINNSPNMDADVRLHNAEGWADV